MLFRSNDTATTEIYTVTNTLSLHDALPTFAIDVPGGGGKIAVLPDSQLPREDGHVLLRNYEGRVFRFPDPER